MHIFNLIATLFFCGTVFSQVHFNIQGGYNNGSNSSMHILVGPDYYIGNTGLSLKYRDLTIGNRFYESKLHHTIGFVDISGGMSYQYNKGDFHPLVGIGARIPLEDLLELTLGTEYMFGTDMVFFNIGTRIRLDLYKGNNKHRFF